MLEAQHDRKPYERASTPHLLDVLVLMMPHQTLSVHAPTRCMHTQCMIGNGCLFGTHGHRCGQPAQKNIRRNIAQECALGVRASAH